ncbi:MAG: hypothetical protein KDD94_05795 [Calditrichaeota bacterium]|nr:hypothetical protein [Calditrichota bacterium]
MRQIISLLVISFTLFAQAGPRNGHSMIYDDANQRIILFGGADEKQVLADTWQYKNQHWTKLTDSGPGPRTFAAISYDNQLKRILLFGGNRVLFGSESNPAVFLNDLWELKNNHWSEIKTSNQPSVRSDAMMVFDPDRNRAVLFGGYRMENNQPERLNDTWEFDGQWLEINNKEKPSGRAGSVFVYDEITHYAYLYGGTNANGYGENSAESWTYSQSGWRHIENSGRNVFDPAFAINNGTGEILRFGGWNGSGRIDETWIFRNKTWIKIATKNSPAARNHSVLIYDPLMKSYFLYGGHDGENVMADLWQFKNGNWFVVDKGDAVPRIDNGH